MYDPTLPKVDLDAHYAVAGYEGIAFYLIGFNVETHFDEDGFPYEVESEDQVRAVMVGDDRTHIIDICDLTKIDEEDYCGGCGQIGCGHG